MRHDRPLDDLRRDVDAACDRIAPTWPLDRFIAVNPYWGWRSHDITDAAARLGSTRRHHAHDAPRSWFRDEWRAGRLSPHEVGCRSRRPRRARPGRRRRRGRCRRSTNRTQPTLHRMALVTDLRDLTRRRRPGAGRTWTDLVMHQISQHCASHFDEWQATWAPDASDGPVRRMARRSVGDARLRLATRPALGTRRNLDALPADPTAAIAEMLDELGVGAAGREAYLTALLTSVNGWAAWCAYRRWQARLVEATTTRSSTCSRSVSPGSGCSPRRRRDRPCEPSAARLGASWSSLDALAADIGRRAAGRLGAADRRRANVPATSIIDGARRARRSPTARADVQAVFCIDVRSEVFRRALESTSTAVHTRGFAGFFGLPIAYTPAGSALTRPQLPGLLAPSLHRHRRRTDRPGDIEALAAAPDADLGEPPAVEGVPRRDPSSVFSFVESMGLLSGPKLVKESLPHRDAPAAWEHDGLPSRLGALRPRLALVDDDPAAAAAIGRRVLTAMGLVDGFAPTRAAVRPRQPQREQPARRRTRLRRLRRTDRRGQRPSPRRPAQRHRRCATSWRRSASTYRTPRGSSPRSTTRPPTRSSCSTPTSRRRHMRERISQLRELLAQPAKAARPSAPAPSDSGACADDPAHLEQRILERANDWSQVRPGVGPRRQRRVRRGAASAHPTPRPRRPLLPARLRLATRRRSVGAHADHDGTDGGHQLDQHAVPRVDGRQPPLRQRQQGAPQRRRWRIGVFEGNGGDLRIGLPMQSLHDGQHTAPPTAAAVGVHRGAPVVDRPVLIDAHAVVHDLVYNGWLHLLRIEPATGDVERRVSGGWTK